MSTIFSTKYFIHPTVLHAPSGITPKINFSLSHNKQRLTYTAEANCGFYYKDRVFSVRCELNFM